MSPPTYLASFKSPHIVPHPTLPRHSQQPGKEYLPSCYGGYYLDTNARVGYDHSGRPVALDPRTKACPDGFFCPPNQLCFVVCALGGACNASRLTTIHTPERSYSICKVNKSVLSLPCYRLDPADPLFSSHSHRHRYPQPRHRRRPSTHALLDALACATPVRLEDRASDPAS